jgi:ATP-binding cassette, subfamily C, bacterial
MAPHAPSLAALAPATTAAIGWRALVRDHAALFGATFAFSILVNLLMLTGPVFMLQLYDRVLASRSEATLVVLFALVAFLYAIMAILDHARGRLMARVGARFQSRFDPMVFAAALRILALRPDDSAATIAQRDLESVQRLISAPVFLALFDVIWAPIFLALIFLFHPYLGWLALGGAVILLLMALLNSHALEVPLRQANQSTQAADHLSAQIRTEAEVVRALGMQTATFLRWNAARHKALAAILQASDRTSVFTSSTKSFRLFLQSAMLAMGGWLVLRGEMSAGAMIAGSIVLGRALAPVEQLVSQWGAVQAGSESMARLCAVLAAAPKEVARTPLPRPRACLDVTALVVLPPGTGVPAMRGVDFRLEPGRALGVIGPSGAGKSTLARAVIGAWPPVAGKVRLDGIPLAQFAPDALGRLIGYLPQRVTLFPGTIAENIARLSPDADHSAILRAAQRAGAHHLILRLAEGYETPLSADGVGLSGGQLQRIGLARALYGDPVLLVLDEPNSNLDADGSNALSAAIRSQKEAGAAVMIMAHRPAAIQECDDLLMLEHGQQTAFGPRDAVLRHLLQNHADIMRPRFGEGGAS